MYNFPANEFPIEIHVSRSLCSPTSQNHLGRRQRVISGRPNPGLIFRNGGRLFYYPRDAIAVFRIDSFENEVSYENILFHALNLVFNKKSSHALHFRGLCIIYNNFYPWTVTLYESLLIKIYIYRYWYKANGTVLPDTKPRTVIIFCSIIRGILYS